MNLKEKIAIAVGIIAILGFGWKIATYVDTRYALAQEVKKIEQRLDYKILSDQLNSKDERIWTIKERCKERPCTDTEREELNKLETEKVKIEKKLDKLEGE